MKNIYLFNVIFVLLCSFTLWNKPFSNTKHNYNNTLKKNDNINHDSINKNDYSNYKYNNNIINSLIKYNIKKNNVCKNTAKVYVQNPKNLDYSYKIEFNTLSYNKNNTSNNIIYSNNSMQDFLLTNNNSRVSKNEVFNIKIQINGLYQPFTKVQLDKKYKDALILQELTDSNITYSIKASGILTCPQINLYENYINNTTGKSEQILIGEYNVYNYYKTNYEWSSQLIENSVLITISSIILVASITLGLSVCGLLMLRKFRKAAENSRNIAVNGGCNLTKEGIQISKETVTDMNIAKDTHSISSNHYSTTKQYISKNRPKTSIMKNNQLYNSEEKINSWLFPFDVPDSNYSTWLLLVNNLKNNEKLYDKLLMNEYYRANLDFYAATQMVVIRTLAGDNSIISRNNKLFKLIKETFSSKQYTDLVNISKEYKRERIYWMLKHKQGTIWDSNIQIVSSNILEDITSFLVVNEDINAINRMNTIRLIGGVEQSVDLSYELQETSGLSEFISIKGIRKNMELCEFEHLKRLTREYMMARHHWFIELESHWNRINI